MIEVRKVDMTNKQEDELMKLAKQHGVLRMGSEKPMNTEEKVAFLKLNGSMLERCGLPQHMEYLLKK